MCKCCVCFWTLITKRSLPLLFVKKIEIAMLKDHPEVVTRRQPAVHCRPYRSRNMLLQIFLLFMCDHNVMSIYILNL